MDSGKDCAWAEGIGSVDGATAGVTPSLLMLAALVENAAALGRADVHAAEERRVSEERDAANMVDVGKNIISRGRPAV